MAHYVSILASFSTCGIPGRETICLSLAVAGILCLAAAAVVILRGVEDGRLTLTLD